METGAEVAKVYFQLSRRAAAFSGINMLRISARQELKTKMVLKNRYPRKIFRVNVKYTDRTRTMIDINMGFQEETVEYAEPLITQLLRANHVGNGFF